MDVVTRTAALPFTVRAPPAIAAGAAPASLAQARYRGAGAGRRGPQPARPPVRWRVRLLAWATVLLLGWALAGNAAAAVSPRWFDGPRPSAAALQAVALLADAAAEGLEPRDYAAAPLQQALAAAAAGGAPDAATIEQLEQGLSLAFERYLSDLRRGRVEPRRVRSDYDPPPPFDAAAALQAALRSGQLAAAVQAAQPRLPLYRALRTLLAHYRGLVGHPAWREPLPPLPGGAAGKLAPGQPWAGTGLLAARLAALGDLAPDAAVPGAFDGALVDALRAFQRRHGLEPDGVIGRATYAQLQVAPARRVRQIELTLERLRWTPLELGPRMIVVNLPEFVLRAYDVRDGQVSVQREMRVVVGRAFDTRTPVFVEPMRAIEFSPYWNVPPSIARSETVPKLRRDPARWARDGYEFVTADGRVVDQLSTQGLDEVLTGRWRIRQRPGPRNALGDIKFVLPNRDNIYLHHTPSVDLFARPRRDFSHGCVRVEQPVALATFVLAPMPEWTEPRIRAAMQRGTPSTVRLAQPLPVLIAYGTALVKQGQAYFFDDLYGLDRVLDDALRRRAPLAWTMRAPAEPAKEPR